MSDAQAFITSGGNGGQYTIGYGAEAPVTVRTYRGPVSNITPVPDDPGIKSGPIQIAAGRDTDGNLVGLDAGYSFAYAEYSVLSALQDGAIEIRWVFTDLQIRTTNRFEASPASV